jgi:hypothetical protein
MAAVIERRSIRLRILGTTLMLLAALMFIGSFVATEKMPAVLDSSRCSAQRPCMDPRQDESNRDRVFSVWMGATLVVFVGGVWLRSAASRDG